MNLRIDNSSLFTSKEHYLAFRAAWARNSNGPNAPQHLLYALLRGHDAYAHFTPISNLTKLDNGMAYNDGIYNAMQWLIHYGKCTTSEGEHAQAAVGRLLAPFECTVTKEMFVDVMELCSKMPVPRIESAYGIGRLIRAKATMPLLTHEDLWAMYEEVK